MKKSLILIFTIVFFASCEKPFTVDNSNYVSKLVVNNLFEQGTPFEISVSNSVNVYDTLIPKYLSSSDVKLYINNAFAETLASAGNGYYTATTIPIPGNTYKVTVSNAGFPLAETESVLPVAVKISDWYYLDSTLQNSNGDYFGELSFTIDDPLGENNYLLSLKFWDDTRKEYIYLSGFTSEDQSLNQNLAVRLMNGEFLFTDNLFNGKRKTFILKVPSGYYFGMPNYLLSLYSLSKDAYFYAYSKSSNGPSNSSATYSNVKNGLGVFAGRSLDTDTIH